MEFYLYKQWSNPAIRDIKWVYLDKYAYMSTKQ